MPLPLIIAGIAVAAAGLGIIHRPPPDDNSDSSSSDNSTSSDSGYPNNSHSSDVQADWDGTYSE